MLFYYIADVFNLEETTYDPPNSSFNIQVFISRMIEAGQTLFGKDVNKLKHLILVSVITVLCSYTNPYS